MMARVTMLKWFAPIRKVWTVSERFTLPARFQWTAKKSEKKSFFSSNPKKRGRGERDRRSARKISTRKILPFAIKVEEKGRPCYNMVMDVGCRSSDTFDGNQLRR